MFTVNGQLDHNGGGDVYSSVPKPILVNSPILQHTDSKKTVDSLKINLQNNNESFEQSQSSQTNMDDFEIKQPIGNE